MDRAVLSYFVTTMRLSGLLYLRSLLLILLVVAFDSISEGKPIRLRNAVSPSELSSDQRLRTPDPAAERPAAGLHLVQLSGPIQPEWREQLQSMGVDLVRYVPEDAFVAEFRNVPPGQVRSLPYVEWVGIYHSEYRLHPTLRQMANATAAARLPPVIGVSVIVSPRATPSDTVSARGLLQTIQQESRLRSGIVWRGAIPPGRLNALASSPAVLWVEPAPDIKLFDEISSQIVAGEDGPNQLYTQALGYDGAGVTVAVADSGLDTGEAATMHPDLFGRTPAFFHYGALSDASDEHSHGTHVAGIIAGNAATGGMDGEGTFYGLGVAPGASIVGQRLFDALGGYQPPPSFETMTRHATRAGAEIGSNSWGDDTQGRYDVSAMEFDELVRDADVLMNGDQQYILEFSAGNAGPGLQTIGSPAVAKNVIATGASQNNRIDLFIYDEGQEAMADFSSRGPTEDGRIKPDVVAPGTWIASLKSAFATDENAWAPIDSDYLFMGGTSQAGPHASGAAAVFVQYYRQTITNQTPSPALVKAVLINSAVDMDDESGTDPVPNMDEGWGRIDLTQVIGSSRRYEMLDQTTPLATSQVYERRVIVAGEEESFKITLTYTDVPGFPGALVALVNDLDLEVIAPSGVLYRGNRFSAGDSFPNPSGADRINNVEAVHFSAPLPGEYIIRVRAHNVAEDARIDTPAVDQDFALVISGDLALPGQGVIAMDRRFYRAPDQIRIQVADQDRAGQPSVSITLRSTLESTGENIVLPAAGPNGVFTGTVATAVGSPTIDGKLQIAHSNLIQALYFDASSSTTRVANAQADLVAPVLSNVNATNQFGQVLITWNSDEPANSVIRYGTNPVLSSLTLSVTNPVLSTAHILALSGLAAGQTYYFYVVSSDEAGNTTTNSNGGALFSFVPEETATVLLVDDYDDPFFGEPPLTGYTSALNQVGVTYDIWPASNPNPSLDTLSSYRVVIWRVQELFGVWSASERVAISNYLQSGGSLFVASMEILSRVEETTDVAFIQNVLQVQSYLTDETGSTGAEELIGSTSEPIGNGIDLLMDYTPYEIVWAGALGPDISDTITPSGNASPVLENDAGDIVGLRWPAVGQSAPGRLVLMTCPLDAVPMGSGVNDRVHLLRNVLAFLAPGASGVGVVALNSSAYSLPGLVTVEVGDSDLQGQGTLIVTASTTTQPTPINVTLNETGTPGVFVGTLELIAATNAPVTGKLRAQNGDTLTVAYSDATPANVAQATAMVDTVAPTITGVDDAPDYEAATVFWETSEPADALVQFGESAILNRTAYNPARRTGHAVTLPGLSPDRTYYYRVVSRDAAGNTAVKDDGGQPYTFNTLTPLQPPWSDNMNAGGSNWVVFSSSDSESGWTLGVPDNGVETAAFSPPHAWGSNLEGKPISYTETFLISPAIALTGGNVARLRFWHSYDFSETSEFDIIEFGQLLLLTNNTTTPVVLGQYVDFSTGWEQEEIDLTPYMGQVIYLVWNHELLSFDLRVRPGWLVDDVSITVSNVQPGTVQITNNLWQATYVLTGPSGRSGKGLGVTITNAAPGNYTIEFGDVAYYQTPPAQTNVLVSGAGITFTGHYAFADINTNGISDAWEQAFFGSVGAHPPDTDSDFDGVNDFAEFVAGTDPTQSSSRFRLTGVTRLGDGMLRLTWPAQVNRGYRVHGSTNMVDWTPLSVWTQAASTTMNYNLPPPGPGAPYLFRVEVRP